MHILDPSQTDQATTPDPDDRSQLLPQQLPPAVREFGFIPDCTIWQPGDLVLFSAVDRDRWQRRIVSAQERLLFAPEHAKWHHVAVYIDKRVICEARPGGIRYRPVDDLVVDHRIRVRRGIEITEAVGFRIALHAMKRLGRRYDYISGIRSWILGTLGRPNLSKPIRIYPRRAVQCARLFHDAYQETTKSVLVDDPDAEVMPAELSGCGGLADVPSRWLRL